MARRKAETAPPPRPSLSPFEGHAVIGARVAITNAGDGLSMALGVEPEELTLGDKVYIVLETEVAKIRFEPVKDTDALARVHTLRAGAATIVDYRLVKEALDAQALKIEKSKGVERLPFDPDEDLVLDEHGFPIE